MPLNLKRILCFILIVFHLNAIVLISTSFASDRSDIQSTQDLNSKLRDMCHNEELLSVSSNSFKNSKGEDARYFYLKIKDEENPNAEPRIFDCTAFGVGPMLETMFQRYKLDPASVTCNQCSNSVDFAKVIALQEATEEMSEKGTCDSKYTVGITTSTCMNDIKCNIAKSLIAITPPVGPAVNAFLSSTQFKRPQILGCDLRGKSNCVQEMAAGIVKNIWDMISGIGYLAKGILVGSIDGVKLVGGKIQSWFSSPDVQSVEDKLSEASIVASTQSSFSIQKFLKDGGGYLLEFIKSFVTSQWDSISAATGCEKWSGVPHASKCEKSYESWRCSSCDQRVNAVCGMVGALGSELLVAYFTGASVNALARSEKFAKAAEIVSKIIRGGNKSALIRKTVQSAVYLSRPAVALGKTLFKAFELMNKIPPFKQWAYLNEHAFLLGLQTRNAEGLIKLSEVVDHEIEAVKAEKIGSKNIVDSTKKSPAAINEGKTGSKDNTVAVSSSTQTAKSITEEAKSNPTLNYELNLAGEAKSQILKLPTEKARKLLRKLEQLDPEELRVFREDTQKGVYQWCR